jgi:hypothetical protein
MQIDGWDMWTKRPGHKLFYSGNVICYDFRESENASDDTPVSRNAGTGWRR